MMRNVLVVFVVAVFAWSCVSVEGNQYRRAEAAMKELPTCTQDKCDCPPPNNAPGDISHIQDNTTTGCLCSCGRKESELCDFSDHCRLGTECVAPADVSNMADKSKGVCEDRCLRKTCPQYQQCSIDQSNGDAICACEPFHCNEHVQIAVEAQLTGSGEERLFTNMCEMVNENCRKQLTESPDTFKAWVSRNRIYS